jgi:hypothetical protein
MSIYKYKLLQAYSTIPVTPDIPDTPDSPTPGDIPFDESKADRYTHLRIGSKPEWMPNYVYFDIAISNSYYSEDYKLNNFYYCIETGTAIGTMWKKWDGSNINIPLGTDVQKIYFMGYNASTDSAAGAVKAMATIGSTDITVGTYGKIIDDDYKNLDFCIIGSYNYGEYDTIFDTDGTCLDTKTRINSLAPNLVELSGSYGSLYYGVDVYNYGFGVGGTQTVTFGNSCITKPNNCIIGSAASYDLWTDSGPDSGLNYNLPAEVINTYEVFKNNDTIKSIPILGNISLHPCDGYNEVSNKILDYKINANYLFSGSYSYAFANCKNITNIGLTLPHLCVKFDKIYFNDASYATEYIITPLFSYGNSYGKFELYDTTFENSTNIDTITLYFEYLYEDENSKQYDYCNAYTLYSHIKSGVSQSGMYTYINNNWHYNNNSNKTYKLKLSGTYLPAKNHVSNMNISGVGNSTSKSINDYYDEIKNKITKNGTYSNIKLYINNVEY